MIFDIDGLEVVNLENSVIFDTFLGIPIGQNEILVKIISQKDVHE